MRICVNSKYHGKKWQKWPKYRFFNSLNPYFTRKNDWFLKIYTFQRKIVLKIDVSQKCQLVRFHLCFKDITPIHLRAQFLDLGINCGNSTNRTPEQKALGREQWRTYIKANQWHAQHPIQTLTFTDASVDRTIPMLQRMGIQLFITIRDHQRYHVILQGGIVDGSVTTGETATAFHQYQGVIVTDSKNAFPRWSDGPCGLAEAVNILVLIGAKNFLHHHHHHHLHHHHHHHHQKNYY